MGPTNSLLTPGYQRRLVQNFEKFARLLYLIWAFRKTKKKVVDLIKSIFDLR
jgi:hypothetical protein